MSPETATPRHVPPSDTREVELLQRIAEAVERMERRLTEIAADTDAIDVFNRPFGDGRRVPSRRPVKWRRSA